MNNVSIVGRLTREPELKYTNSNTAVISFTVAVNRTFKNKDGEYEADFIRCQAWRKTAEIIAQYGEKGMRVGVEGRIQTRSYDGQDGKRVYITEVVTDQFHFLESKSEHSNNQQQNTSRQQNNNFNDSFEDDIHIDDGDLPF